MPPGRAARSGWLITGGMLAALVFQGAHAQSEQSRQSGQRAGTDAGGNSVETIVVTANGSQVELPPDYAGGQISRGGRIGMFGNLDIMDTPFQRDELHRRLHPRQPGQQRG